MAFISKWCKDMTKIPARVYFVAAVFALSTVYVSQEAGYAFAQAEKNFQRPEMRQENFEQRPMRDNKFDRPEDMNRPDNFRKPEDGQRQDNFRKPEEFNRPEDFKKPEDMRKPEDFKKSEDFKRPEEFKNEGPDKRTENSPDVNQKSGEDFDKQQEKMEAQRAEQMKKQFAQMKKQFTQMGNTIKRVEARIAALEKQGVKAPADLTDGIAQTKAALAVVDKAQSMEDEGVEDAMDVLRESGQTLGDSMRNLEMLSQMPKMLKKASAEIKKLETSYTKSQKLAARLKIDVTEQLADFRKSIDAIKEGYASAEQLIQSGDVESAMDVLKSDVWENMQEAYQYPGLIEALGNVKKYVSNFDKFIAKAAKSKLVTADADGSEALADMRQKVAELKQLVAGSPDPEDIRSAVSDIFDLQTTVQNIMGPAQQSIQAPQNGNSNFDFSSFGQPQGL